MVCYQKLWTCKCIKTQKKKKKKRRRRKIGTGVWYESMAHSTNRPHKHPGFQKTVGETQHLCKGNICI